ncbi:MAG: VWA domain-containing protein [Candidatus Obscuribacterales bacterium]|nr:VWA domain-containing protein [Candidatus Obscuribacterales bacterium]
MIIAHPLWLLSLLLLPLPFILFRRKGYVGHSNLRFFDRIKGSSLLHALPITLLVIGFVALAIALARPQDRHIIGTESFKSRDILVSIDVSGSMEQYFGPVPPSVVGETDLDKEFPGKPKSVIGTQEEPQDSYSYYRSAQRGTRRIDNAIGATLDFVKNRNQAQTGDRIGIFVFDTDQYWSWPLTHDLKIVYRKAHFADEGVGGGTNFGRTKPGPLDAATTHLDEMGKSKTRILIMVTDGEDQLADGTFERLRSLASDYDLRLYVIGVGESISRGTADILRLAEATGGKAFAVDRPGDLNRVFDTIDKMEQSVVTVEVTEKREELFHYFAYLALGFFLLGTIGQALVLNR